MTRQPPEDDSKAEDESKAEAGVEVSNGDAVSPKKQSLQLQGMKDATSRPVKPKKPSKEERKMAKVAQRNQKPQPQEEGAGGDLVAVIARRYGDLPVRFFQATLASPRPRIWTDVIEVVTDAAGRAVLLRGWVQSN